MDGVRIAWFSPFPPVKTGIAGCSAELVDVLRGRRYTIDTYPDARAHDFPWRHQLEPYDLVVYQFGNSSHHDYEWPYALRYPGLVVLHDTRLHHARAALLLREKRVDDYRAEFRWTEPDVSPDAAEIAIAGLDSALYYDWTFVRPLVEASRLVAVHGDAARHDLVEALSTPNSSTPNYARRIISIRLGHGVLVPPERETRARRDLRARYGIADDAVLFGCFGGLTPEKRITQILAAFRAVQPHAPNVRLMLAGGSAPHFQVIADANVIVTGYLETDDALTAHIAACDVALNLRWPTARETSGPWLRALAAGKATVMTDLAHMTAVPSLDPRTWRVQESGGWRLEDGKFEGRGSQLPTSDLRPPTSAPRSPSPSTFSTRIIRSDWRCGGWRRMQISAHGWGRPRASTGCASTRWRPWRMTMSPPSLAARARARMPPLSPTETMSPLIYVPMATGRFATCCNHSG